MRQCDSTSTISTSYRSPLYSSCSSFCRCEIKLQKIFCYIAFACLKLVCFVFALFLLSVIVMMRDISLAHSTDLLFSHTLNWIINSLVSLNSLNLFSNARKTDKMRAENSFMQLLHCVALFLSNMWWCVCWKRNKEV